MAYLPIEMDYSPQVGKYTKSQEEALKKLLSNESLAKPVKSTDAASSTKTAASGIDSAKAAGAITSIAGSVKSVADDILAQKALSRALERRRAEYLRKSTFGRDVGMSRKRVAGEQRALESILSGIPGRGGRY